MGLGVARHLIFLAVLNTSTETGTIDAQRSSQRKAAKSGSRMSGRSFATIRGMNANTIVAAI